MKKKFLFSALAAVLCFAACNKEIHNDVADFEENYFQVHFDANGATEGTVPEDMTMVSGKKYTISINLSKTNCEFLGFAHKRGDEFSFLSGKMDGQNYVFDYNCNYYDIKKDTLYFLWDRRKVTITYHANGASGEVPQPLTFDLPKYDFEKSRYYYDPTHKSSLPDTVILANGENLKYQDGYYLTGWNTKADGTGVFLPKGLKYVNALDDADLYAVFENHNGHEYVDLGLPSGTLWAKTNIGTTCEAMKGDLFAYGETTPKDKYTPENFLNTLIDDKEEMILIADKTHRVGRKEENYSNEIYDFKLLYMQDAASVNWGNLWHIPTFAEFEELFNNCTIEDYDYPLIETKETLPTKILRSKINGEYIIIPAYTWYSVSDDLRISIYTMDNSDKYFSKVEIGIHPPHSRRTWYCTGEMSIRDFWYGIPVRPVTIYK